MLIDDETPWVRDYRGLWGLDTRDRFGGERAPAGPRYERDGTVARPGPTRSAGPGSRRSRPPAGTASCWPSGFRLEGELARARRRGSRPSRESVAPARAEAVSLARPLRTPRPGAASPPGRGAPRGRRRSTRPSPGPHAARRGAAHPSRHAQPPDPSLESPQAHLTKVHGPRVEEQRAAHPPLALLVRDQHPAAAARGDRDPQLALLASLTAVGNLILLFIAVEAFARRRLVSFLASVAMLIGVLAVVLVVAVLLAGKLIAACWSPPCSPPRRWLC